jgi:hypothetical protein
MAIYSKKTSERVIASTIRIDPDCFIGAKVAKFRASVEKPRVFYLMELIEDDPGEITQVIGQILHPERTIRPLAEIEKEAILTALRIFDGDKLATATALGIGKTTLYRKLAEYGEMAKHPLYQEMQAAKPERDANEAQNQDRESQTSSLNS